jgi:microsomal dipeptidase-like Zn-dependent dipeptidase
MGLHHFFDNELGGSLHGLSGEGLSDFGRAVVRRLETLEFIIDVAHSSPAVVDDVLEMTQRPVVLSHTGLHGVHPSARNLKDEQMKRIAAKGGLIGIGYWDAVGDITPEGVVTTLRYAIDLVGEDHVSLGSDYDGTVTTTFDTSELVVLTQKMMDSGFSDAEIAKVMGGNAVGFLSTYLPQ